MQFEIEPCLAPDAILLVGLAFARTAEDPRVMNDSRRIERSNQQCVLALPRINQLAHAVWATSALSQKRRSQTSSLLRWANSLLADADIWIHRGYIRTKMGYGKLLVTHCLSWLPE